MIKRQHLEVLIFCGNFFEIEEHSNFYVLSIWVSRSKKSIGFRVKKDNPNLKQILSLKSFNVLVKSCKSKLYIDDILLDIIKAPTQTFAHSWDYKQYKIS